MCPLRLTGARNVTYQAPGNLTTPSLVAHPMHSTTQNSSFDPTQVENFGNDKPVTHASHVTSDFTSSRMEPRQGVPARFGPSQTHPPSSQLNERMSSTSYGKFAASSSCPSTRCSCKRRRYEDVFIVIASIDVSMLLTEQSDQDFANSGG